MISPWNSLVTPISGDALSRKQKVTRRWSKATRLDQWRPRAPQVYFRLECALPSRTQCRSMCPKVNSNATNPFPEHPGAVQFEDGDGLCYFDLTCLTFEWHKIHSQRTCCWHVLLDGPYIESYFEVRCTIYNIAIRMHLKLNKFLDRNQY